MKGPTDPSFLSGLVRELVVPRRESEKCHVETLPLFLIPIAKTTVKVFSNSEAPVETDELPGG